MEKSMKSMLLDTMSELAAIYLLFNDTAKDSSIYDEIPFLKAIQSTTGLTVRQHKVA